MTDDLTSKILPLALIVVVVVASIFLVQHKKSERAEVELQKQTSFDNLESKVNVLDNKVSALDGKVTGLATETKTVTIIQEVSDDVKKQLKEDITAEVVKLIPQQPQQVFQTKQYKANYVCVFDADASCWKE